MSCLCGGSFRGSKRSGCTGGSFRLPLFRFSALECWRDTKAKLRDPLGGYRWQMNRDFSPMNGSPNTQNPMMHLFESLLTLHEVSGSDSILADAGTVSEFVTTRFFDKAGGFIPENYDAQWKAQAGGAIEIGHQFEWAYLLAWAAEAGLPASYLGIGNALLDFGLKAGFDSANGGIANTCDYRGKIIDGKSGWWQQAEHLRSLLRYASRQGRDDLWPVFDRSLAFTRARILDTARGGWYREYDPANPNAAHAASKGDIWKEGYHDAGFFLEALRVRRK